MWSVRAYKGSEPYFKWTRTTVTPRMRRYQCIQNQCSVILVSSVQRIHHHAVELALQLVEQLHALRDCATARPITTSSPLPDAGEKSSLIALTRLNLSDFRRTTRPTHITAKSSIHHPLLTNSQTKSPCSVPHRPAPRSETRMYLPPVLQLNPSLI
ncbi:hypothetical protein HBI56_067300 [Parastagonospora nodorum]|nr:hypothetical protein HBH56_001800 [Parastagonospora nodorum]KAH3937751.1 hypothetical protein HBH54_001810 [Parastagonospora nodorum]KAH3940953.1 hypothetical protein HBH53_211110 [Parastagonospora nodorum]KAH3956286.1 hypothetical protein HBH51_245770 [Parastagonospora nodorum]KAH3978239.1 hypothetical protein HBH52_108330 [Parastagonospora nodorum]